MSKQRSDHEEPSAAAPPNKSETRKVSRSTFQNLRPRARLGSWKALNRVSRSSITALSHRTRRVSSDNPRFELDMDDEEHANEDTDETDDDIYRNDVQLAKSFVFPDGDDVRSHRCASNHPLQFARPELGKLYLCDFCGHQNRHGGLRCHTCDLDICLPGCYPVFYQYDQWRVVLLNNPPDQWQYLLVEQERTNLQNRINDEQQALVAEQEAGEEDNPVAEAIRDPRYSNIPALQHVLLNCLWYSMIYRPDDFEVCLHRIYSAPESEHYNVIRIFSFLFNAFGRFGAYFREDVKLRILELLADPKLDVTFNDNSALVAAASSGFEEMVHRLLVDQRVQLDSEEQLALLEAARNGHTRVVDVLLQDGRCSPSSGNYPSWYQAAENGHYHTFSHILKSLRGTIEVPDHFIVQAAQGGKIGSVAMYLKIKGVDPTLMDCLPLQAAAAYGKIKFVKHLLADPRMSELGVSVAFGHACAFGHLEIAKLIRNDDRCDPEVKNIGYRGFYSPVFGFNMEAILTDCTTPLTRAIAHSQMPIVKFLLADPLVDLATYDWTTLDFAVKTGSKGMVQLLLNNKAYSPQWSAVGYKVLMNASLLGFVEIFDVLMSDERVTNINSDLLVKSCRWGNTAIVKRILDDRRFDQVPNLSDCLISAVESGEAELADMLLQDRRINAATHNNAPLRLAAVNAFIRAVRNADNSFLLRIRLARYLTGPIRFEPLASVSSITADSLHSAEGAIIKLVREQPSYLKVEGGDESSCVHNPCDRIIESLLKQPRVLAHESTFFYDLPALYRVRKSHLREQQLVGVWALDKCSNEANAPVPSELLQVLVLEFCGPYHAALDPNSV